MSEPSSPYTAEQLKSDAVSKKDILQFVQEHASTKFLKERKLYGKLASIAKCTKKDDLISAYENLFATKAFKTGDEDNEASGVAEVTEKVAKTTVKEKKPSRSQKEPEAPRYTKRILKKGNSSNFPQKKDTVGCFYKGMLMDGTVFDTNIATAGSKKKKGDDQPLKFKVGQGQVIRGWDEALLTMSVGEKAEIIIEPEWAYGKKGKPEAK
jgi:FK506-binding protein 3